MGFGMTKGTKQVQKPGPIAGLGAGILFESLFPGLISEGEDIELGSGGAIGGALQPFLERGGTLPTLAGLGEYTTIFEKASAGTLDPMSQTVFDKAIETMSRPVGLNTSQISQLSSIGSSGEIAELPDPPTIGKLTSQIIQDLPGNFQTFINNIMQDSSPEAIQAELDNLTVALQREAATSAESLGSQVLSVFASQGITGGAAIQGMQQLALQIANRTLDDIARARLAGLETLIRARDQGINLMNSLLQSGAAEQANIVRQRIAQLESQTAIQVAKIQATAEVQKGLIAAQANLQIAQMGFTGDMFRTLFGESVAEEQARQLAIQKPFDILTALTTGAPTVSRTTGGGGFDINLGPFIPKPRQGG